MLHHRQGTATTVPGVRSHPLEFVALLSPSFLEIDIARRDNIIPDAVSTIDAPSTPQSGEAETSHTDPSPTPAAALHKGRPMPVGLRTGNDAFSAQAALDKPQEMTTAIQSRASSLLHKDTSICPTDQESVLPQRRRSDREGGTMAVKQGRLDKKSWDYIIRSGIAGGIAGCAAKTVVGPLDRVKILFQASSPQFAKYTGSWLGVTRAMRDIYGADGLRGLFRGHSATLLRVFPYAGIKFLAYEQIRARIIPGKEYETSGRRFVSGSLAGMLSVFFTYPLEVIRVRLAFETKRQGRSSLFKIVHKIYNEAPPPPVSNGAALRNGTSNPIVATVAATTQTIHTVTPRSGVANFFRGFTATLCGMVPYAGASFLTHDLASDFLRHPVLAPYTIIPNTAGSEWSYDTKVQPQSSFNKPSRRQASDPDKPPQLRSWAELASGGFAGFVSQTVSYPLEVIRRRMQVGGVVGDGHRLGMVEVARNIFRERGWRGFFVGLGIGYVKVVPMVATSFFVYERSKWVLGI